MEQQAAPSPAEDSCGHAAYWSQVLNTTVHRCRLEELHRGYSPSRVFRVHLEYGRKSGGPPAIICKENRAPWPAADAAGWQREWLVYTQCLSRLPRLGPALIHAEWGEDSRRLVLEDLLGRARWHRLLIGRRADHIVKTVEKLESG